MLIPDISINIEMALMFDRLFLLNIWLAQIERMQK